MSASSDKNRAEQAVNGLRRLAEAQSLPSEPGRRIEQHARAIANTMADIHGGEWLVQIDHQIGLVLVRRS